MLMALALIQAVAAPLPAGVEDDLKCIAAMGAYATSLPEERRRTWAGGAFYFLGRIDRAVPNLDYRSAIDALLNGRPPSDLIKTDLRRC